MSRLVLIAWIGVLLMFFVSPAHAYIDPGAGSMLLQILLGGIAGLVVFLRLFWHRILAFFGIDKPQSED